MPVKFPTRTVAVVAATAAAGLSGAVIAGAADSGSAASGTARTQQRQAPDGRGPGGPGGHRHGPHADISGVAAALGVSEAKLRAALDAARPDSGARDGFATALAAELGVSSADVQTVLDAQRPDRPRGGRPDGDRPASAGTRAGAGDRARPDDSALAAALAKQLSITQAKAQAALDALREQHDADRAGARDDFYAAVAKALGEETAAVKAAFEASRP